MVVGEVVRTDSKEFAVFWEGFKFERIGMKKELAQLFWPQVT